jgi:hypothetical protein
MALDAYRYGGHIVMMGKSKQPGQDADYILKLFGDKR